MASSVSPVSAAESRGEFRNEMFEACGPSPRLEHLGTLLVHLPDYGILICKPCKFAVQPKAIASHLLRHHIYRDKRRRLLDQVANLTLLEPDDVSAPSSKVSPFPHLPIATGYRCILADCGHLSISEKRMSLHMRTNHAAVARLDFDANIQQVHLQTFFRGNKVRYFEVDPGFPTEVDKSSVQPLQYQFLHLPQSRIDDILPPIEPTNKCPEGPEIATITQHQIEDLMYFHQYMTSTGLSLTRGTEPTRFWTHDLPLQAATQPFLMHGILGVAAFHQALLASDGVERTRHHAAGLRHQSTGLATFRSIIDQPSRQTSTALTTFARLLGVQFCVEALLEAEDCKFEEMDSMDSRVSKILEILLMLKGGTELLLRMQNLLPVDSPLILSGEALQGLGLLEVLLDSPLNSTPYLVNEVCTRINSPTHSQSPVKEPFRISSLTDVRHLVDLCLSVSNAPDTQQITVPWINGVAPEASRFTNDLHLLARVINESRGPARASYYLKLSESQPSPYPVIQCYPYIPPVVYAHLASLPAKLLDRVLKPSHSTLTAFNNALAALVSSYSRTYAADTTWARWNGIESWPMVLPDDFLRMIEASNPLALILVAHWVVLLSMQEESYWFMQGQSQRLLNIVLANLDPDLQDFVRSCFTKLGANGA